MITKFRGICQISKEMVFGDLIHGVGHRKGNVYILPNIINLAGVKHCHPLDGVNVIPETVAQFIGVPDKNNVEIYANDILNTETGICTVICQDLGFAVLSPGSESIDWERPDFYSKCEVIGNTYQNRGLLNPNCCGVFPTNDCTGCSHYQSKNKS